MTPVVVEDGYGLLGIIVMVAVPVVGAGWAAWLSYRQRQADARIDELERLIEEVRIERDELRHLLRAAVVHIREWLAWSRQHAPGTPAPELPDELRDEV